MESLSAQALFEYFMIWDLLRGFQLSPGVPDHHRNLQCQAYILQSPKYDRFFVSAVHVSQLVGKFGRCQNAKVFVVSISE